MEKVVEWYKRIPYGLGDEIVDMVDSISFPIDGDDALNKVDHIVGVFYLLELMQPKGEYDEHS